MEVDQPTTLALNGAVATITLDMVEKRNALSVELVESLGANLDAAIADNDVRVIVLTNNGNTFCAGADLSAPTRTIDPGESRRTFVDVFETIITSPKPVVGRINGHCMGGGVGLAAVCDISIASTVAKFGFTEVRIGVAPAIISVVCLPKMSVADATELFLTGERVAASRAADVGLINRAVNPDELDTAMEQLVDSLVKGGPSALSACKELIARVPQHDRTEAFEWTARFSANLFRGEEAKEGIAAFKERRPASWVPPQQD